MSHFVYAPQVATDTWLSLIQSVDALANEMSNGCVTAIANSTGEVTTGNAVLNGIMSFTTVAVTGNIRGGTVASGANLAVTGNVIVGTNYLTVIGANVGIGTATPNAPFEVNAAANIDGTATFSNTIVQKTVYVKDVVVNTNLGANVTAYQIVWSFSNTAYSSGKILAQIRNGNSVQTSEMVLAQANGLTDITVYATVNSPNPGGASAPLGSWGSQTDANGNFDLIFLQNIANSSMILVVDMING